MIDCQIVILAAGNGTRMASNLPKVMHEIGGKSMLERVISNAKQVTNDLVLVISPRLAKYISPYPDIKIVTQNEPYGTGHAVFVALQMLNPKKPIAIWYADNPFISPQIINELIINLKQTNAAVLNLAFDSKELQLDKEQILDNGRIITDENNKFIKIIEFKNASKEEKEITLCNSGVMAFAPGILQKYLTPELVNLMEQKKGEVYLTGLVEVLSQADEKTDYLVAEDPDLLIGINTQQELRNANIHFSRYGRKYGRV